MLRTRKILLTMMDETDIDDDGRPEAAVNEVIEFIHFQLFHHTLKRIRDTMALVLVSCGKFYKRYRWKK